jgi:ferredoxin--NADP+ reductase
MGAGKDRSDTAGSLAIGGLRVAAPAFELGLPSRKGDPELDWLLSGRTTRDVAASQPQPAAPAPAASASSLTGPGVVLDVTSVGPSVRIFRVGRPDGFVFEAGQSMKLGVDVAALRRRYSIASAPHEEHLEFCIEGVPGGALTSRLFELRPGESLALASAAKGSFTLRTDRRRHVMVATVTGIAPLRSMLRDALARGNAEAEFWVLHGASYADELPYAAELTALASQNPRVHYVPSVSRPWAARNQGWTGSRGRVDALVLPTLQALGSKRDVAVYACGHPEMVRSVRERLEPLGYLVLDEAYD